VADESATTDPPSDEELGALRELLDTQKAGGVTSLNGSYVLDAVRTPIGKLGGALSGVRPDDLAAHIVGSLVERSPQLDPAEIDDVYFGDANGGGRGQPRRGSNGGSPRRAPHEHPWCDRQPPLWLRSRGGHRREPRGVGGRRVAC